MYTLCAKVIAHFPSAWISMSWFQMCQILISMRPYGRLYPDIHDVSPLP